MNTHTNTETDSVEVQDLKVSAYTIPTSSPESDGTAKWNSTTLVLVEVHAADKKGIGYTYANVATATLIDKMLKEVVSGMDAMNIPEVNTKMIQHIRNEGSCGIAMMAVSAVDNALWDLKAKFLDVPLCTLFGKVHDKMLIYGSGGFTSYNKEQLQKQFSCWVDEGIKNVKMKIGRKPSKDVDRVRQAREAIGDDVNLFVDANGAYTEKFSVEMGYEFSQYNVSWFEEPVSSDNLKGLNFIRDHIHPSISIAAGEYGYNIYYFRKMLEAKAVDVLQADATRCGGLSGFLKAGYLAESYQVPFSSHCAPALHLHAALSLPSFYIAEYFYDHARIEKMLFDGVSPPDNGYLKPDLSRPGLGLEFKHKDAEKYKI